MKGIPIYLQTKQDWLNAIRYVQTHKEFIPALIARLEALVVSKTMKVLKSNVTKPPQELSPDDFEDVDDPASAFVLSGLSEHEIQTYINSLKESL